MLPFFINREDLGVVQIVGGRTMPNIIIRRSNKIGNTITFVITLMAWLFNLFIIFSTLAIKSHVYSDRFVVLELLLGMNSTSVDEGIHIIMICLTLIIIPTLFGLLSKNEAACYD
jgi:hypothetical protein